MKRILIALALALGATAAVAEPTLEKRAETSTPGTSRKRPPTRPAASSSTTTRPATPSTRNRLEPKGSTS